MKISYRGKGMENLHNWNKQKADWAPIKNLKASGGDGLDEKKKGEIFTLNYIFYYKIYIKFKYQTKFYLNISLV